MRNILFTGDTNPPIDAQLLRQDPTTGLYVPLADLTNKSVDFVAWMAYSDPAAPAAIVIAATIIDGPTAKVRAKPTGTKLNVTPGLYVAQWLAHLSDGDEHVDAGEYEIRRGRAAA